MTESMLDPEPDAAYALHHLMIIRLPHLWTTFETYRIMLPRLKSNIQTYFACADHSYIVVWDRKTATITSVFNYERRITDVDINHIDRYIV